jgi:hypothetical protein
LNDRNELTVLQRNRVPNIYDKLSAPDQAQTSDW